jgi:hypothetical protein
MWLCFRIMTGGYTVIFYLCIASIIATIYFFFIRKLACSTVCYPSYFVTEEEYNTIKMPINCKECPLGKLPCMATYNQHSCHAELWRHFFIN